MEEYINGAGTAVDGWWQPVDGPVAVHQDVDIQRHVKMAIITVKEDTSVKLRIQAGHF